MSRRGVAGPAVYALACALAALVLAASGLSDYLVRDVASIGGSHAIRSGASTGPQNILLMGLESRTDWNGRVLPGRILGKLHAGSRNGVLYHGVGGNDTNTLILIHIPAGGQRAIGYSIPRDDLVNFAGTVGPQQQGKVDQAYGVSLYYRESQLRQKFPHMGQDRLAFLGNEAGRTAAVATVEKLTGVHIDHFAEVNLAGFYELAKVFGGVEVCLKHPVRDSYSGANFTAGYQHLDAQQALAFVRQRHGLPNGDLDRTHRQQAFIDSIIYQLRHQGVLGDLSKLQALLGVAKRYVITDSGWSLLDFATQMRSLTSGHLLFRTAHRALRHLGKPDAGRQHREPALHQAAGAHRVLPAAHGPRPRAPARDRGRSGHRRRLQRNDDLSPGRRCAGRPGQGRLPAGHGRQHRDPGGHGGPLRPGRRRRRPGDRDVVRGDGRAALLGAGRARARAARGRGHRAPRHPGGQPGHASERSAVVRAARRHGQGREEGRHPVRGLSAATGYPPEGDPRPGLGGRLKSNCPGPARPGT